MHRPPSLPTLAPGAAARALAEVEALRAGTASPARAVAGPTEGPLRAWAIVIAVAAAAFLLLLALLYVVSFATASRPELG